LALPEIRRRPWAANIKNRKAKLDRRIGNGSACVGGPRIGKSASAMPDASANANLRRFE